MCLQNMVSTPYAGYLLLAFSIACGILFAQEDDGMSWELRLVNGDTPLDGTPEVLLNEGYAPICDEHITPEVAMVICRELGFSPNNVTMNNEAYSDNRASFLRCSGDETSLMLDCGWILFPTDPCQSQAGISCNGNIRLVYGVNITQGNIQVYRDGRWEGICDHNARATTAKVVCRQMGYDSDHPTLYMGSYFGPGVPGSNYIECRGDESTHEECQYRPLSDQESCDEDHNLAVDCFGEFLSGDLWPVFQHENDPNPLDEGYRKVSLLTSYDEFGTWCDDVGGASEEELQRMKRIAAVLCVGERFSRFNPQVINYNFDRFHDLTVLSINTMECTGRENNIAQCVRRGTWLTETAPCNISQHVVLVKCNGFVQLADGTSDSNGRVEMMDAASGTWQPWLVPYPDHAAARVLCQQLGFESYSSSSRTALRHGNSFGRAATEEAWPYVYTCNGVEGRIQDCQQEAYEGRSESERLGHMGIDCNAPPIDASFLKNAAMDDRQTALNDVVYSGLSRLPGNLLLLRSGSGTDWALACVGGNVHLDTKLTGVLCHGLGFSRFRSSYSTLPLSDSDSMEGKSDLLDRAICKGTEKDLTSCSLDVGDRGEPSSCEWAVILQCQERATCSVQAHQADKKEITCYKYCETLACDPSATLQKCSIENGGGCMAEKSYTRTGFNFDLSESLGICLPNCESDYSESFDFLRSRECCYSDECNKKETAVSRFRHRVKLQGGWEPYLGAVLISVVPDQWRHVNLDERRVPESFLGMLCREAGYSGANVARVRDFKTIDGPSFRISNYSECDVIGSSTCQLSKAAGVGDVLAVDCNARSPQLRLVGGLTPNMGRLEVMYQRQWGTVCDQGFTRATADIVCRTLGYPGGCSVSSAEEPIMARFRSGRQRIGFSRLRCQGDEKNLLYCDYKVFNPNQFSCTHEQDVGIICETWPLAPVILGDDDPSLSSTMSSTSLDFDYPESTTTTMSPVTSPVEETTSLTCAVGTCSLNCERTSRTFAVVDCGSPKIAFCFTEQTQTRNGATSFRFGCMINGCNSGNVKVNNINVKTSCCSSPMCNLVIPVADVTDDVIDALPGFVNLTNATDVTNVTTDGFFTDDITSGSTERMHVDLVVMFILNCIVARDISSVES